MDSYYNTLVIREKRIQWLLFLFMESLINLLEDHELLLTSFELNNIIHVLCESGILLLIHLINYLYITLHWINSRQPIHLGNKKTKPN